MIENLTIENYRSFKSYSMNGLKRVNLLTGYNNSGKSSLLEAVELLASAGDPTRLLEISQRRNEHFSEESHGDSIVGCIDSFFGNYGVEFIGPQVRIDSEDTRFVMRRSLSSATGPNGIPERIVVLECDREGHEQIQIAIPIDSQGRFSIGQSSRRFRSDWAEAFSAVEFVGTQNLVVSKIAEVWDKVQLSRSEKEAAESLQILDDRVERIAFVSSSLHKKGMHLGLRGEKTITPIGSHGEGMQRLLALALHLATVKGGILLVDEIDTGLHYSVLADMWKLVIATAIKNDIQVFATTHSLDCLRGLNEACERNPEFASEVSTQTIDRNLDVAIAGDATDLRSALDLGIEVR